jgi:hypothetical protein
MEYEARKLASEPLRARIQNCAMAFPADCRIDAAPALALCRWRPAGPDYLVLNGAIDGHRPLARWRTPAVSGPGQPTLHLYSCRALERGTPEKKRPA